VSKWKLLIQEYNFNTKYISGTQNIILIVLHGY